MPDNPDNPTVTADEVKTVFDLWQELLCARPRKLDDKRTRLIKRAISAHGSEECLDAIRGCSVSEWHQGKNPQRKKYTDIELILRDAKHIEMFADIWHDHDHEVEESRGEVAW